MKYQLTAPSWFDRIMCRILHDHYVEKRNGSTRRRCLTFGCGMLTVTESPLAKLHRKSREAATKVLYRGGRE